jgi:glycosyltransferase involved in cell wall biosynthesis
VGAALNRILIAVPAYNEESTIGSVVAGVREHLTSIDLLVVDDGSRDGTSQALKKLGVMTATHLCNLGYGRAIQTAIKYAVVGKYDALITLDGDGQHDPRQIPGMIERFAHEEWDVLVGSRYVQTQTYLGAPLGRRVGMQIFSIMTRLVAGRRIYDTSSGLKIMRRAVFEPLTHWHFVDFHAEAIIYLMRLGYRIGEYPISASERKHGQSMYSAMSHLAYPLKTSLMILLGVIEASIVSARRER